ncbi:MAG: serine/threonine protein kinase [Planctomycetota bacterium]|jgi:serine/threonine protein kinase
MSPDVNFGGCVLEKTQSKSEHSTLYKAHSEELGRDVMIKLLDPRYPISSRTARRFIRGGELAVKMEHPNIVQTYAAGAEGKTAYMLMEFLPGHSLNNILKVKSRINYLAACDIIIQIAQAMEYANSQNVVHRKIDPSHIMLSPGGKVAMLGFGLARLSEAQDNSITADGALVNIGPYTCPETGQGVPDIRADLYSLGAVFYQILAGKPLFVCKDALEYLRRHKTEPPWPVRDLVGKELPESVEDIVHSLLEKDPAKRIQTPTELIACLNSVIKPDVVGSSAEELNKGKTLVFATREIMGLRQKMNVLICDGKSHNIKIIHEVMHRLGFNTLTTRDARAAAEAAKDRKVDLMITDTKVPGLDAEQLINEFTARNPKMPVILTRGGRNSAILKRNPQFNISEILERPLDPKKIREAAGKSLS